MNISTLTPTIANGLDRKASIDVLRGLAALSVLAFHARYSLWTGFSALVREGRPHGFDIDFLFSTLGLPWRFGYWGVPMFFVISGYCIHRPEARKRAINGDQRPSWALYFFDELGAFIQFF